MREGKVLLLGDETVGKTSLAMRWYQGIFPTDPIPAVFEENIVTIITESLRMNMTVMDACRCEESDRLVPLYFPLVDAFVIAFNCVRRDTFESVRTRWHPDIVKHAPKKPFILVATKIDLRESAAAPSASSSATRTGPTGPVTYAEGDYLARELGAVAYLEVSTLNDIGVEEALLASGQVANGSYPTPLEPIKRSKGGKDLAKCSVM